MNIASIGTAPQLLSVNDFASFWKGRPQREFSAPDLIETLTQSAKKTSGLHWEIFDLRLTLSLRHAAFDLSNESHSALMDELEFQGISIDDAHLAAAEQAEKSLRAELYAQEA